MKILLLSFARKRERMVKNLNNFKSAFSLFALYPDIDIFPAATEIPDRNLFKKYDRVIFSGSEISFEGKNETEQIRKLARKIANNMKEFIFTLHSNSTPSLAICFGHQLWAYVFGSKVVQNEDKGKAGTFKVKIRQKYKNDPLVHTLPGEFYAAFMHQDVVCAKPPSAEVLAEGEYCDCAIMCYGNNSYTTQFHPEFSKQDLIERQKMFPNYFKNQKNPLPPFQETYDSQKILKNFIVNF